MDEVLIHNLCALERIDPRLFPVIEAVRLGMVACCGDQLREIRLQGSVARGDAGDGLSDLDMIALVDGAPTEGVTRCLGELAATLGAETQLVSRLDLEASDVNDLQPFRRFVLSSDSVCIHGNDALTKPVQSMARLTLARLVTSELVETVPEYVEWADELEAESEAERRFACRVIAKDLLKVLRGVLLLRGATYQVGISQIAAQATYVAPEAAGIANRLHALYREPIADVEIIRDTARTSASYLLRCPEISVLREASQPERRSS